MAKYTVNTYSAEDVSLIISGWQVEGWESISVTKRLDSFIPIPGIRNKHTRVDTRDRSSTLVFPVLQTERSNDVLSQIHSLDIENGTGRLTFMLKDNSGTTLISSDCAYIQSYPELVYNNDFSYRVWTVFSEDTNFFIGGNAKAQRSSIFDSAVSEVSNFIEGLF